jgi:hypothetical protein
MTFNDLILSQKGKRICIMGGADSLAVDLEQIQADVYISTNGHGSNFVPPDYVLAMDETHQTRQIPMLQAIREATDAPIISPRGYADYQLASWPQAPRDVLSGMVAAWAAFVMGAKVVILTGMNGYKDKNYVFESSKMARDIHCPVRVVSDELSGIWPMYDPSEKFGRYKPHPSINAWLEVDEMTTIEVLKATQIRGVDVKPGDKMPMMRHQALRLLKHKMVREVAA